ncbi:MULTISPECIES: type II toxin-antitoxin system RelE family toxin [unclassified Archaeoglobus]|mgnify:CR=1 FL=1|jgi:mRNA interferase RelE/StbE|uniref:type II toxin-antitoxin system RelE family toxin n=1 Tax=unclassified Archaeoglobus TaxID=2643606 RepID=UPI0025C68F81|nr:MULTISPECIES: type II toxin-antitoxin system RelE/ParE family toxin [unclassified Archaeoglobus]
MRYEIFLSRQARKFLDRLDVTTRSRIAEKLKLLSDNPFALPYKKIKDRENTYRIRIGDFRVIYVVRGNEIRVLKIDKRERVYDRL